MVTLPLWFAWGKFGPARLNYDCVKSKLIEEMENTHGRMILFERTILPRWWTESYINYKIGSRYFRRYMDWEDDYQVYLNVDDKMNPDDGSYDEYFKKMGKSDDDEEEEDDD